MPKSHGIGPWPAERVLFPFSFFVVLMQSWLNFRKCGLSTSRSDVLLAHLSLQVGTVRLGKLLPVFGLLGSDFGREDVL